MKNNMKHIDRDPGNIEGEMDAGPGHEGAKVVQFAQPLRTAGEAGAGGSLNQRLENPPGQSFVQSDAATDEDLRSGCVQRGHCQKRNGQDHGQKQKRGDVFVDQHTIVDLHQIQR